MPKADNIYMVGSDHYRIVSVSIPDPDVEVCSVWSRRGFFFFFFFFLCLALQSQGSQ